MAILFMMYSPPTMTSGSTRSFDGGNRGVDRIAQTLDDGVDLFPIHDERRCDQDVVTGRAVDRAAHWIDHQAARHGFALDERIDLQSRRKRLLRIDFGDQLDAAEQAAAADVADVMVVGETLFEAPLQMAAHGNDIVEQPVAAKHVL